MNRLKIPQIHNYIHWLGNVGYRQFGCSFSYDPKTYALLDELFSQLMQIEPSMKNNAWNLWLKADRGSVDDFGNYEEWLENGEVENYTEFEQLWKDECPNETEWFHFQAIYEKEIDYRAIFVGHKFLIEQDNRKKKGAEHDISEFVQWLVDSVKDIIVELKCDTYNKRIQRELPFCHRIGTLQRKYEWEIYPKQRSIIMGRMIETDLDEFLKYACGNLPTDSPRLAHMTANDFYNFCSLGYRACGYDIADKNPKEQYRRYADGRDDGLGEIDAYSPEEFDSWYHNSSRFGGHPWEVCRGGNSTHIDLYVLKDAQGWYLQVAGSAWTRCAEAALFFLALYRAGIPVCIYQAELLKARFIGEEKIGIVPSGVFPAYCHSYFPGEDVIDFMHLPDDDNEMSKLLPHCVWQPIEEIMLKNGADNNA